MCLKTVLIARKFYSRFTLYFLSNNSSAIQQEKINDNIDRLVEFEERIKEYEKMLQDYSSRKEDILKEYNAALERV